MNRGVSLSFHEGNSRRTSIVGRKVGRVWPPRKERFARFQASVLETIFRGWGRALRVPPGFSGIHPDDVGGPNPSVPILCPHHQTAGSDPRETRCPLNESGAARRPPGDPRRLNPQRDVLRGAGGDRRGRGKEEPTNSGPFELSGAHSPRGASPSKAKTASRKLFQWTPERKARAPTRFPGRQPALGFRGRSGRRSGAGRSRISAPPLGSPSSASPSASRPPTGAGRGGSRPRRPGRGKRPAARAHLDPPARR